MLLSEASVSSEERLLLDVLRTDLDEGASCTYLMQLLDSVGDVVVDPLKCCKNRLLALLALETTPRPPL